ncbi:hypothetical protein [uncultured Agrococcus sp.]|uniref:hypothetical protein n=1 Tax=uncultured Agrococcus sp. TaxID=382258 RepID=UPI0025E32F9A|nr:hypothetical protein [uncultured Agrococcus sp.]
MWGDHRMRSLLLYATVISGAFAGYALPSMLSQPADFSTVMSLRWTSWILFAVGLVVAPTLLGNRTVASFALSLHVISSIARTIVVNGDLPQPVTYGVIDAYRFVSVATLVVYWMALRLRHPLSVLSTMVVFCAVIGTFFLQGSIVIRAVVEIGGVSEQATSQDETIIWSITGVTGIAILVLCSWFDSYCRTLVPLCGAEYQAARIPVLVEARHAVTRQFRMAWVFFALFLDVLAVFYVCRVLRHPLALGGDKEWYARLLLCLSVARMIAVLLIATMTLIVLFDPVYRPIGRF